MTDDPNKQQKEEEAKLAAHQLAEVLRDRTETISKALQGLPDHARKQMLTDALAAVGSTLKVSRL